MNKKEFFDLLSKGESEAVEFKREVTKDFGEEVCAFANADGGQILVGVNDEGGLIGCQTKKAKEEITQFASSLTPPPDIEFSEIPIGKIKILVVRVKKSKKLCSLGGVVYVRVGTAKRPLALHEIFSLASEQLLLEVDKVASDAPASELDEKCLTWFMKQREKRGFKKISKKRLLEKIGVIATKNGRKTLTLAGLLFFHKNPQQYLPHACLRLVQEGGWKRFEGPMWKTIDEVEKYLLASLKRVSLRIGFRREDYLEYPIAAVREAVTNSLAHRNYAIFSETFIYLEKDKLRIVNPGCFPPGTSVERPRPIPRNPILYELLFQSGYVERQGVGIELIQTECAKHPLVNVEFKLEPNFTEVIFYKKPAGLSDAEAKILSLLALGECSSSELAEKTELSKVTILKIVKRLIDLGLVEEFGKGPAKRYRAK